MLLAADLQAALLWDLPTLRGLGDDARAFIEALSAPPWDPEQWGDGPLSRAAHGVLSARVGEEDEAERQLRALSTIDGSALLASLLVGWLLRDRKVAGRALEDAFHLVEQVEPPELRSRLLLKTAALARDIDANDLQVDAIRASLTSAPAGSRLLRVARMSAVDVGLMGLEEAWSTETGPYDALLSVPWVEELALDASTTLAKDRLLDESRGAWGYTFRAGTTPVDRLLAADAQASWAARHDVRNDVRRQLGAALLSGHATHTGQWVYGCWAWVVSNGQQIRSVIRRADPHLDQDAALAIIAAVQETGGVPNREERLIETAAALWHLFPDDTVEDVLRRFALSDPLPLVEDVQGVLGANLARRSPQEFFRCWQAAPESARLLTLSKLSAGDVATLDDRSRRCLRDAGAYAIEAAHSYETAALTVTLTAHLDGIRAATALADTICAGSVTGAIEILELAPEALSSDRRTWLVEVLWDLIDALVSDAHSGKFGFGSGSSLIALGKAATGMADASRSIGKLLAVAEDGRCSSRQHLEARQGLTWLRHADELTTEDVARVRLLPDHVERTFDDAGLTASVLYAARLGVLVPEVSNKERLDLLASARDPEPRVRQLAIAGLGRLLKQAPGDDAEWALVGGLFDPSDDVVRTTLWTVRDGCLLSEGPLTVAAKRLERLSSGQASDVRAAAVGAARRLIAEELPGLALLVSRALQDPSWLVRHAAMRDG